MVGRNVAPEHAQTVTTDRTAGEGAYWAPRSPRAEPIHWLGTKRTSERSLGCPRSPKCQPTGWHEENDFPPGGSPGTGALDGTQVGP